MEGLFLALSGATVQERRLEMIANNLANLNTTGFKREIALFDAWVPNGVAKTIGPQYGLLRGIATDFSSGPLRRTGAPLDIAIEGEGFFVVQTPQGNRFTRDGHFTLDAEGRLVTQKGMPVLGTGGGITLPAGSVSIDPEGRVSVRGTEVGAQPIEVDTLQVVRFEDPSRLRKVGDGLLSAGEIFPAGFPEARLLQGALEGSNVDPIQEMVSMIEVLRLYEAAQKAIQISDDLASKAANDLAKLA